MTFFSEGFPATTLKSFVAVGGGWGRGPFFIMCQGLETWHNVRPWWGKEVASKDWKWLVDTPRLKKVGCRRMKSLHVHVFFLRWGCSLYKFSLGSAALLVNRWNESWFILSFFIITNTWAHNGKLNQVMLFRVKRARCRGRPGASAQCTRVQYMHMCHEVTGACAATWAADPADFVDISLARLLPWHFPGVRSILI